MRQKANRQMDAGMERAITQNRKNLSALSSSLFSHLCVSAEEQKTRRDGRMNGRRCRAGGGLWFIEEVRFFPSVSALLSDISNALDTPPPLSLLLPR